MDREVKEIERVVVVLALSSKEVIVRRTVIPVNTVAQATLSIRMRKARENLMREMGGQNFAAVAISSERVFLSEKN